MYERILVPTDGSEGARSAADHAIELASVHDATLHVIYVADVRMSPLTEEMDEEAVQTLLEDSDYHPTEAIVERAEDAGVPVTASVQHGVVHEVIDEYVDANGIDLIVMGTHGRSGVDRTLLGSVTERVLRTVDVPVLAVQIEAE